MFYTVAKIIAFVWLMYISVEGCVGLAKQVHESGRKYSIAAFGLFIVLTGLAFVPVIFQFWLAG